MSVHGRRSDLLVAVALATALVGTLFAVDAARAQERDGNEPRPIPRRGFGTPPFSREGGEARWPEPPTEVKATKGFVFLDGVYLPPPYEIRYADNALSINGQQLTCQPTRSNYGPGGRGFGYYGGGGHGGYGPAGSGSGGYGSGGPGGFGPGGSGRASEPWRFMVSELAQQLAGDSVVMSFPEQPLVVLGSSGATYDLLKKLNGGSSAGNDSEGKAVIPVSFLQHLPEGFDHAVWNEWIDGYKPPADLRKRGALLVAAYDATEKEAMESIAATKRLNAWVYPLTIGLMIVTVLAVGHLLGGRPHAGQSTTGVDDSPVMVRALNWSLIFVALLSVGDLVLTMLAGQAGQMRELNPVGSHLIHDPQHLVGFKVGATFPAIALLWLLRKHKRAQIAAWWICLILVMVAFRWLTVSTAFVSV